MNAVECADVDEEAGRPSAEELPQQVVLSVLAVVVIHAIRQCVKVPSRILSPGDPVDQKEGTSALDVDAQGLDGWSGAIG